MARSSAVIAPPAGAVRQLAVLTVRDFTGGLNLRDDSFQVPPNESPDMENIDIQPTGGVARRKSVGTFNTVELSQPPRAIWTYLAATPQVLVQLGGAIAHATSAGVFTTVSSTPLDATVTGRMRAATMARLTGSAPNVGMNYIARNGEATVVRYDGSAFTSLTVPGFNDDPDTPAGGKFPECRFLRQHLSYMFAASTVESGTAFKTRLRWSWPGEPEDWRTLDYIDIDPGDRLDEITGLSSWGDQLLIFKRKSVHILSGYSPETFQVTPLTLEIGAVSQETIASTEDGVAFFDQDKGVFFYDGKKISWLWEKLVDVLGDVEDAFKDSIQMGWVDRRLYCSVPINSPTGPPTQTFVYDPRFSGWMKHTYRGGQYGTGALREFTPRSAPTLHLACSPTTGFVWRLEGEAVLDKLDGATDETFVSQLTTAWFDAGSPGLRKRWRRPTFIADDDVFTKYVVDVWRDYQLQQIDRSFTFTVGPLPTTPTPGTTAGSTYDDLLMTYDGIALYDSGTGAIIATLYDDGSTAYDDLISYDGEVTIIPPTSIPSGYLVWGEGVWGQLWGSAGIGGQGLAKGSSFGNAYAVRLRLTGPTDTPWNLNAMQLKYLPGRVR